MESIEKTKSQLISENEELKVRISELESSKKNSDLLERALLESEHHYRSLYKNAPLSYQSLDERGIIIEINEEWCNSLGYEREEVIGMNFIGYLTIESQQKFKDNFLELKEKDQVIDEEYEMLKKDGSHLLMSFESKAVYSVEGAFKRTHSILYNITERRQIESQRDAALKELKENEEKLNTLLNATSDIAFLADSSGTFLAFNDAFARSVGRKKEELIGKTIFKLFSGKIVKERTIKFQEVIESKKHIKWEDNRAGRYFDNTVYPILDDKGNVKQIAAYIKDITDSKQAEEVLRNSEEKYSTVVESSKDAIIIHQDGIIKFVNRVAEQLMGYSVEEFLEKNIMDFVAPKY